MYHLDEDLKWMVENRAKQYGMGVDEFFNVVLCMGLYAEQIDDDDGEMWNATEQFYKGLKGYSADYEITHNWFTPEEEV